jgi:L-asparaginase
LERTDVRGIVVAHGTDTLAYTSSAVAFALGDHLDRPIVFTASQTTVEAVHGDARSNLVRACMVAGAAGRDLPEVMILFGDRVLRACRAQKVDDRRFDAFDSPSWPPLARITQILNIDEAAVRSIPEEVQPLEVRADFDDRILFIPQVPGLRASVLDRFLDSAFDSGDIQGVIIQSLGAGNLPTVEPYSLVGFVERAIDQDIPVVLGSRFPISMDEPNRYEPSAAALRAGAIPLFNMTEAALLTKFAWILGQMKHETSLQSRTDWVSKRILSDYVGEVDPSGLEGLYRTYQKELRNRSLNAATYGEEVV